jgi:hypothetical protein
MDGLASILLLGFTGLKINYTEFNYHADVITLQGLSSLEKSKLKMALFYTSLCNILHYLQYICERNQHSSAHVCPWQFFRTSCDECFHERTYKITEGVKLPGSQVSPTPVATHN